jgi:hypothetical protein
MLHKRVGDRELEFHAFFASAIVKPGVMLPIFVLFTGMMTYESFEITQKKTHNCS